MSNKIKAHKSNNNSSKKNIDLFKDNKSLKIHPNKLIHRSHSKQSTNKNTVKEIKDSKKTYDNNDKNELKNKEKFSKHRKEDSLSPKRSISSSSKTKSQKTDDKYENHKNIRPKKDILPTLKDDKKYSNNKTLNTDIPNDVNLPKFDTKNSSVTHSKTGNNIEKFKINEDIYKPKKITERRKSFYHDDKAPYNVEKEKSIFKRRNSYTSSKTTCLESDKKLNILQINKQLSVNNSQLRKRSTSSDVQSDKENLTKHSSEKKIKLSENSTKITVTENKVCKRKETIHSRKRSNSELSLFSSDGESKLPKTAAFSAFSSLDDTEVIAIDKTKILPPIDDFNSPYVSFGDFLKNNSIPLIESSPKAPEFLCTPLGGDKLLIKKRNIEKKAILIDITDDGDDELNNNNVIQNVTESPKSDEGSSDIIKATESSSKLTVKEHDIKIEMSVRKSLDNDKKTGSDSIDIKKTQNATESSPKIKHKIDCDVLIKNTNKINGSKSLDDSFDSIDKKKEQNLTEKNAISVANKSCDDKIRSVDNQSSVVKKLNNSHENSLDSTNKKKTQSITGNSSKISPEKNSNVKMKNSEHKTNVAESLDNRNENSSDSIKKRRIQKDTESSPEILSKNDCDIKIKSSNSLQRVVEDLDINCNSDKFTLQKFQILCTKSAVEYITSDLVSVLNIYVDYKQYIEKLKSSEDKEANIKDYFVNNRLKFLKSLCKKLQNVKVHTFKTGLFFDNLIESIKIHVAPKEILNEKTISRFIHNVLILFKENCSTPDDYYILYNHVVSVKSLQYLDQKSFSLSGSVDKLIFDSMNSFSVKLKRSKEPSNSLYKDNTLPLLYCIDNSPDKITDVTPGNSLPCINTGETLVTKISPARSSEIDMIPQISIVESSNEKDNMKKNLIDLLQNKPTVANLKSCVIQSPIVEENTNNQSATAEKIKIDKLADYIELKLSAIFNESPVIQKTSDTIDINVSHQTKTVCSPNSDDSDDNNFMKNINQNKSYLTPMSTDINAKINASSSVPHQTTFDNARNSLLVTPTSTSTPKTNRDNSNKHIKIINDIVVTPAIKEIALKPQSNPISLGNVNNNDFTKPNYSELNSNSLSDFINPSPPNNLKTLVTEEKNNKVAKRPYVRKKPLSERKKRKPKLKTTGSQLTIDDHSPIENYTALSRPFPTAGIHNDTFSITRVTDNLNSKPANASTNSPPSYMMNQILQYSKPVLKSTIAPIQLQHTASSYLPRQYSDPVQRQQTASTVYIPTQQSQSQIQVNPVPLSRQLSTTSQLQEPTLTGPLNLISSMTENILEEYYPKKIYTQSTAISQLPPLPPPPPPPPPTISRQSYLPNTSSSLGTAPSLHLQSSNPHEKITCQVTLEQVVERTLIHHTQTVHTPPTPNFYSQNKYIYEKHLQEKERQAFRLKQAEQDRQEQLRQQQHQEILRQQKHQEMLRQQKHQEMLRQQKHHEMLRQKELANERLRHQQKLEMLRKEPQQNHQEMINSNMHLQYNYNNKNLATVYNSNNYYSAPLRQVAQPQLNEYTYPTSHSEYPAIYNNFMPQSIHDSLNATRTLHYLNNQHINQNYIRRNNVPATSTQCSNNNLIYPPTAPSNLSFGGYQYSEANNYLMPAAARNHINRNVINAPMQNNTVSQTSVIVANNGSNAIRSPLQQIETEPLLTTNSAVANTSQNQTMSWKQNEVKKKYINKSLEQHIKDLEECLNKDITETRSVKEMDNSAIRNSSRDSGYMTPTTQKDQTCAHCLGVGNFFCSGCVNVYYCSEDCQTKAWPSHQNVCCFDD